MLELRSVRYRPGGRDRANPASDQYKLEDVVVRDSGKIVQRGKEAVFVGEKIRYLEVVRDRVIGCFIVRYFLVGGGEGVGLNSRTFPLWSTRVYRFSFIKCLTKLSHD